MCSVEKTMVKLLFTAPLLLGSTSYELYRSFKKNKNCKVYVLDEKKINSVYDNTSSSFFAKLMFKLKIPLDKGKINKLLSSYDYSYIDIVFIINGVQIRPSILRKIKKKNSHIKLVSWSQDDMYAWHNRSIYYTFGLKYYDLIVTQKSYNVEELKTIGAKNVLFQNKAYSKYSHIPYECHDYNEVDVLFVGFFEKERFESMLYLADNGVVINIYGSKWEEYTDFHDNLIVHNVKLAGKEYSKAISCAKLTLCFLRKVNRDLQTSRSIEIPACRGFMVAERTSEHASMLEEDKEAVYFNSNEELLAKVQYYLVNDKRRGLIAKQGYKKITNGGFSYNDRVSQILSKLDIFA
jgi:spore maturation protein CgeB